MEDLIEDIPQLQKKPPMVNFLRGLSSIGLGRPETRVVITFLLTGGLTFLLQPRFAFDESGAARPFILFEDSERATYLPWWGPAFLLSLVAGLFL